jgi:hypothetical protein
VPPNPQTPDSRPCTPALHSILRRVKGEAPLISKAIGIGEPHFGNSYEKCHMNELKDYFVNQNGAASLFLFQSHLSSPKSIFAALIAWPNFCFLLSASYFLLVYVYARIFARIYAY